MTPKERKKILAEIEQALTEFPKVIEQKKRAHRHKEKVIKPFMKLARKLQKEIEQRALEEQADPSVPADKSPVERDYDVDRHKWRICPIGSHLVKAHTRKTRQGKKVAVKAYCQNNRSKLDVLNSAEISIIATNHFGNVKEQPCPRMYEFGNRENVDLLIAGWTKYWNEVLKPSIPLSPNVVKALIASESSFINLKARPAGKGEGKVRGLMQITDSTIRVLRSHKGEIKDHLLDVKAEDLMDPNVNICAGIRWLFQKRKLAESKIGTSASWDETVQFYKGYRNKPTEELAKKMRPFRSFLEKLETCR